MVDFKKILCTVLASVFVVSAMASCANNGDENSESKKPVSGNEGADGTPEFVDADFDEDSFKFLHYGSIATDFTDEYIWSESFEGAAIGDAVMERNGLVEDRYNVVVSAEECGNGPMSEAVKRMQAGQCDYDVIYEWGSRSKSAALDGMLYDLNELDINLENSWWVPNFNSSLTVLDRLFVFTNMVTMNSLSWADMYYFNKMLMDKLNYAYPYDYVYQDSWTLDVALQMALGAEEDLNGDGQMTAEDQFSGYDSGSILGGYCHEPLTKDNGDGTYTVITYTEAMVAAYNTYKNKVESIESLTYEDVWASGADMSGFKSKHVGARFYIFGEDHSLFMGGSIDMTKEFVNMKSDYGVIPPAAKKAGDPYNVGIDFNAPQFSMPIQLEDPEMAAIVFDYMAYESERLLLPAYYETTIKTKRMEDVRDYDMLDIIRDSVSVDWTNLYLGGSDLGTMRGAMMTSGNFASVAKRYEAKCQSQVDEVLDIIANIDA